MFVEQNLIMGFNPELVLLGFWGTRPWVITNELNTEMCLRLIFVLIYPTVERKTIYFHQNKHTCKFILFVITQNVVATWPLWEGRAWECSRLRFKNMYGTQKILVLSIHIFDPWTWCNKKLLVAYTQATEVQGILVKEKLWLVIISWIVHQLFMVCY